MDRRKFLQNTGFTVGAAATFGGLVSCATEATEAAPIAISGDWTSVRAQFDLDHSHIQMSQMLLASHPAPVREAIQKHRDAYDSNPATYWEDNWLSAEIKVSEAAAKYMGVAPEEIALTDSTTMGTALLFNGMKLKPGDEVLATTHDHYVTDKSIDYACEKSGATVKRIDEYADPATVTVEEVTTNIANAISDNTRVVMVTWVQSCTGVKLPVKDIAEVINKANEHRDENNRIYYVIDGVHGFGNQDMDISAMDCDFFSAGTHKWMFGPRGTGVLYGRKNSWDFVRPTIPAFAFSPFLEWLGQPVEDGHNFRDLFSPGGFHAFDHRWSLDAAFNFQMEMGRSNVYQRTTDMSSALKEGIRTIDGVELLTPMDPDLSAGINCFRIGNQSATESVELFHKQSIIASASPYRDSVARLTPCVINTDEEVDRSLKAMKAIA